MAPPMSSRGLDAHSPVVSTFAAPLKLAHPHISPLGTCFCPWSAQGAAYMMLSDWGNGEHYLAYAWFVNDDLLPMLRLHQFHRPSDGTSGESRASSGPAPRLLSFLLKDLQIVKTYLLYIARQTCLSDARGSRRHLCIHGVIAHPC